MNKYDKQLKAARSAARSAAWLAARSAAWSGIELEWQIDKVLEVLDDC